MLRSDIRWPLGLLIAFVGVVVAQHAIEPGLSAHQHQISEYTNGSAGGAMVAAFLAWAASVLLTAVVTARSACVVHRPSARAMTALLLLAAAGLVVTACFVTQTVAGELPLGASLGTTGRLHDLGSGAALAAFVACVPLSFVALSWPARVRWTAIAVLLSAGAITVGLAALGELPGVRQRVLVGAACLWQALTLLAATSPPGTDVTAVCRNPRRGTAS